MMEDEVKRLSHMSIYKYLLQPRNRVVVDMPRGSTVLCVQVQNGLPHLWATVFPGAPTAPRAFYVVGTGHSMPERFGRYVGTFQMEDGALVFHVFEEKGD